MSAETHPLQGTQTALLPEQVPVAPNTLPHPVDMTPVEATPQPPSRLKRALAAGAAVIGLFGIAHAPSEQPDHMPTNPAVVRQLTPVELQPLPPPSPDTKIVPPATPQALLYADKLLSRSENLRFQELLATYSYRNRAHIFEYPDKRTPVSLSMAALEQVTADKYGLTVHDAYPYSEVLYDDLYPEQAEPTAANPHPEEPPKEQLPFASYKKQADAFLAQYGIQLDIGSQDGRYFYNFRRPAPSELETAFAKRTIYNIMQFISRLPVELVQFINLKHIVLAMPGEGGSAAAAYAGGNAMPDAMALSIHQTIEPNLLGHEAGHLLNTALGRGEDLAFTAFNDGKSYDAAAASPVYTMEGKFTNEPLEVNKKVVFLTKAKSPEEEKADQRLLDPSDYRYQLDPAYPAIKAKFLYSFARLAQYQPSVAAYMADISGQDYDKPRTRMFNEQTVQDPVALVEQLKR